jgi:1-deoxy-D-xylulose-5-phosphate synthase
VDEALVGAARQHRLVAPSRTTGGSAGSATRCPGCCATDVDVPVKTFGLPQEFLSHGEREEMLEEVGLTPQHLARQITEAVARRSSAAAPRGNAGTAARRLTSTHTKRQPE